jgi:ferric-chelate reductase
MDMTMGGGPMSGPFYASGVDFSNYTQAYNFFQEILDDSILQPVGQQTARNFWYGIIVVVGITAICKTVWTVVLHSR